MARAQLESARRIASDVARRAKAGELARADQHQADGAVAAAEASLAQAEATATVSLQQVKALSGTPTAAPAAAAAVAEPEPPPGLVDADAEGAAVVVLDDVDHAAPEGRLHQVGVRQQQRPGAHPLRRGRDEVLGVFRLGHLSIMAPGPAARGGPRTRN